MEKNHDKEVAFIERLFALQFSIEYASYGWIAFENRKIQGVVRCTSSGVWEVCADPYGEFDRCANAKWSIYLKDGSPEDLEVALKFIDELRQRG